MVKAEGPKPGGRRRYLPPKAMAAPPKAVAAPPKAVAAPPKAMAGTVRWVLPAAIAALVAIAWLAWGLDLDVGELLGFLRSSALFVLGILAAAALGGAALRLAKGRWRR